MSLIKAIETIEEERALNQTLLERLLEGIEADILRNEEKRKNLVAFLEDEKARLERKRDDLRLEFAERDAGLLRLIDGGPAPAVDFAALKAAPVKEPTDARLDA